MTDGLQGHPSLSWQNDRCYARPLSHFYVLCLGRGERCVYMCGLVWVEGVEGVGVGGVVAMVFGVCNCRKVLVQLLLGSSLS